MSAPDAAYHPPDAGKRFTAVRREIAAAATSLDRLDAMVSTGETGWTRHEVRRNIRAGLALLGVWVPAYANREWGGPVFVAGAAVPILVVQPREPDPASR